MELEAPSTMVLSLNSFAENGDAALYFVELCNVREYSPFFKTAGAEKAQAAFIVGEDQGDNGFETDFFCGLQRFFNKLRAQDGVPEIRGRYKG